MKKIVLAWTMAVALVSVSACSTATTSDDKSSAAAASTAESASTTDSTATPANQMAYICPMECKGSASMQPGKCPVCKMDLTKNPAYKAPAQTTAQ